MKGPVPSPLYDCAESKTLRERLLVVYVDAYVKGSMVPVGVMIAAPLAVPLHLVDCLTHLGAVIAVASSFMVDPILVRLQTVVALIGSRQAG